MINKKYATNIIFLTIIAVFGLTISYSQETLNTGELKEFEKQTVTDYDKFTGRVGISFRFEEIEIGEIRSMTGGARFSIRIIEDESNQQRYYLRITMTTTRGNEHASISYPDLIEINKALESIQSQSLRDSSISDRYIENKFISNDGFIVGYLVDKGKLSWFVQADKYAGSYFLTNKKMPEFWQHINEGISKIESLKS